MKHLTSLIIVSLFCCSSLLAQTKFHEGYVVDNKGVKKKCLLANCGTENSGLEYVYKIDKDSAHKSLDVENFKEFGVDDQERFIREEIIVDLSYDKIKQLKDTLDHSEAVQGHAFLQEVIGSPLASLYYFYYEGKEFFFYKKGSSKIQLLLYKKYQKEVASGVPEEVYYDRRFQEQLNMNIPCSINHKHLNYSRRSLSKYFRCYIEENNGEMKIESKVQKGSIAFRVSGGIETSLFTMLEPRTNKAYEFSTNTSPKFGAELEYCFPFNRRKLGLCVGGYFSEGDYKFESELFDADLTLQKISIPVSVVYYFNLTDALRVFVKGGIVIDKISGESRFRVAYTNYNDQLSGSNSFNIGAGICYKRFNLAFFTNSVDNYFSYSNMYGSEYTQTTFQLSYDLFKR